VFLTSHNEQANACPMTPIDQFLIRYEGRSIGPWRSKAQSLGTQSESMHSCSPGSRLARYRVGSSWMEGCLGICFWGRDAAFDTLAGQPVMFALC
jgi:hypothetical protein